MPNPADIFRPPRPPGYNPGESDKYQTKPVEDIQDVLSKPIPGPEPVGPEYVFEPDYRRPVSVALGIGRFFLELIRGPAIWIKTNIVEPNRGPKYYYYHRKYPRVLPIDECYADDQACQHEAHLEYDRNRRVDRATLELLRWRRDNCLFWHTTKQNSLRPSEECKPLEDTFRIEETHYHMKYGDLHYKSTVMHAYNKQKHRMIIERRRAQMADNSEKKPE